MWFVASKDKKGITITHAFQPILDELNRKPDKLWVDKGSEFFNRSIQSSLQDNGKEMYSTHNEGKHVVAERFIRALKNKIHKYTTSTSKNVYNDKVNDIVNKYNNTYPTTIKMKPVNVKSSTYIDFGIENNVKDPKFRVGDHLRISKYKKVFAKTYFPNWSEEDFIITKVKNTVLRTYVISDINGEELFGLFYEKEL